MRQEIVDRAIAGDRDAFNELVVASTDRLFATARLILRDGQRAADAVQDAMVLAWRDISALRDPNAWEAWLYRLKVRACYKIARKERRRNATELHVELEPLSASEPDQAAAISERDRLGRQLGALRVEQRAVIVLHFWADLTLVETARVLDIPVGTVKSRLHHALSSLRASLAEEPER